MADNTTVLGKSVIIGGSEHLRDSDFEESLVEGTMNVGDSLKKGSAETQVVIGTETGTNFKGIVIAQSIRQSDTDTHSTTLTAGLSVKYLKPTGFRTKVRVMCYGFDSGGTIPSGANVFYNSTGSTTAQTNSAGDFFADTACSDDSAIIGRLSKEAVLGDAGTNDVNTEIEMWY